MAAIDQAKVLLEQGRFDLSERFLRDARAAAPGDGGIATLLAFCLLQQQKLPEGEKLARVGASLSPQSAYAHFVLGTALAARNSDHEAALRELKLALEL